LPGAHKTHGHSGVVVRKATRADAKPINDLITGLARFERLKPPDANARARLSRDIFDRKLVNVFVAADGKKLVGYALYFYTYSSFLARPTLYLEDIFVSEESRQGGVGKALFMKCVREAIRLGCRRMEWQVLTWNRKAIRFYQKLGAERLDEYRQFRLNWKGLQQLSQRSFH
jgi:GNAT superfamily N-acetyltransferase